MKYYKQYMKCDVCNSEKIIYAGIGYYCHDCEKLYTNEELRTVFTKALINRNINENKKDE